MSIIDGSAGSGLWLLKFERALYDGVADPTCRLSLPSGARAWRSIDGMTDYVYVPADGPASAVPVAPGEASMVRLEPLFERIGELHGTAAGYHYVVETDVVDAYEDEFNCWYDEEHLPGLAAVSGTIRAVRYRAASGSPRYYACYDLATIDVLTSAAWLAVRATDWSARIRPMFRNTRRTLFCRR